ncbi:phage virion morphogenesis protein [Fusobacterium necrophorum]|uniref:phage virion morphogenesis protein n=1 Tax=Fusobacterium necrophorum TaxID=859 RepID=UPI001B8D5AE9|nr:phage virion morphogenesis protein [Fusobacterium necrophorum]MBR8733097.1 hypothetical protein [Fusobacterium necrophorum]MBR8789359.1 hypothetical protein [Fusobacterium necrophorum]
MIELKIKNDLALYVNKVAGKVNTKELMEEIANDMQARVQSRFRMSVGPDGHRWFPIGIRKGKPLMNTGLLSKSISSKATMTKAIVGTNNRYARLHNYGGVIRAKSAGALTIPISPKSYGKSARRFRSAFLVRTPGATFIAREIGRGKKRQLEFLYVLKQSAKIKARPFLGINTAMQERYRRIAEEFYRKAWKK